MTDRPAPRATPPAQAPAGTPPTRGPQGPQAGQPTGRPVRQAPPQQVQQGQAQPQQVQQGRPAAATAPARGAKGASRQDPDATAVRPAMTGRLQAAFSSASDQHAANADPASPGKAAKAAKTTPGRAPRRARLRLTRIDPWSVMKTAFLLSIAFAIVTVVSVFIVWSVLGVAGVWDSINNTVKDVIGGEESADFDVENYVGLGRVMGFTMLVSVIDVVLMTAMATLGAFLYNMAAALLGGIDVTLAEDER